MQDCGCPNYNPNIGPLHFKNCSIMQSDLAAAQAKIEELSKGSQFWIPEKLFRQVEAKIKELEERCKKLDDSCVHTSEDKMKLDNWWAKKHSELQNLYIEAKESLEINNKEFEDYKKWAQAEIEQLQKIHVSEIKYLEKIQSLEAQLFKEKESNEQNWKRANTLESSLSIAKEAMSDYVSNCEIRGWHKADVGCVDIYCAMFRNILSSIQNKP